MLDVLMWSLIGVAIVVFIALVIVGHFTNFNFTSSMADVQILMANIKDSVSTLS